MADDVDLDGWVIHLSFLLMRHAQQLPGTKLYRPAVPYKSRDESRTFLYIIPFSPLLEMAYIIIIILFRN
jgi:hypothetical protein